MTVSDLLTASAQDLGYLASGEALTANDAALGLSRLNLVLDWLKLKKLFDYTVTRTTWAIGSGTTSYTVGSAGTVVMDRPVSPQAIDNIGYQDTSVSPTLETLFGGALTEDAYAALAQKSLTSVYPTQWYYNPTYPTGTLKPWPVPTSTTLQGVIYMRAMVAEYAAISDTVTLPPGYRRFLQSQTAIEMAPALEVQPPALVVNAARESLSDIKAGNVRMADLATPDASGLFGSGGFGYDINAGP